MQRRNYFWFSEAGNIFGWMPREDSNLDKRYQKPLSYH